MMEIPFYKKMKLWYNEIKLLVQNHSKIRIWTQATASQSLKSLLLSHILKQKLVKCNGFYLKFKGFKGSRISIVLDIRIIKPISKTGLNIVTFGGTPLRM